MIQPPTITGTTNLPAGSTVALVITDANGAQQTVNATVQANGSFSVDAEWFARRQLPGQPRRKMVPVTLASASDSGVIDVTAPSSTVMHPPDE